MKFTAALLGFLAATTIASPVPQETTAGGEINAVIPEATSVILFGEKQPDNSITADIEPTPETSVQQASGENGLDKRAGPILTVIGITAVQATAIVIKIAVEIGAETIKTLKDWNPAREAFTKKTIDEMWRRNPDYRKYPAAICYNKGYHFQNGKWSGYVKAKFELYTLWTNYDCMYMEHGNQFYTHAEGGWINLAYRFSNACTHDARTGDLSCR